MNDMKIVIFNAASFILEFFKLYLITAKVFRIRQKKSLIFAACASLLFVICTSYVIDYLTWGIVYGVLAILSLSINARSGKQIKSIVLSYIAICTVDVLFSNVCVSLLHFNLDDLENNRLLMLAINSFSLMIIVLLALLFRNKEYRIGRLTLSDIIIYIAGGTALALYLTALQFIGFGEVNPYVLFWLVLGLSLTSIIFIVVCVLLQLSRTKNESLLREQAINQKLLVLQKDYYNMLLEKENKTRAFRHDIKNHIYCMNILWEKGDYEELGKYLAKLNETLPKLSAGVSTGNDLVSAIVNDMISKFPDVELKWRGFLPEQLKIAQVDLCSLFYNLLINAFEAAVQTETKGVAVDIKILNSNLLILVSNDSKEVTIPQNDGVLKSSKSEAGHGYGIGNIRRSVNIYHGDYFHEYKDNRFTTRILFMGIIDIE